MTPRAADLRSPWTAMPAAVPQQHDALQECERRVTRECHAASPRVALQHRVRGGDADADEPRCHRPRGERGERPRPDARRGRWRHEQCRADGQQQQRLRGEQQPRPRGHRRRLRGVAAGRAQLHRQQREHEGRNAGIDAQPDPCACAGGRDIAVEMETVDVQQRRQERERGEDQHAEDGDSRVTPPALARGAEHQRCAGPV